VLADAELLKPTTPVEIYGSKGCVDVDFASLALTRRSLCSYE